MALSRWQRTIVNETGDIQQFAQITVLNEETQGAAAIYADRDGNSPLAGGVATADASGFVYFYTEVGRYRIQSAGLQIDWRDVEIGGGYALLQGGNNADFTTMPKVGGDYIVESGSNANGSWTKWASGTMISTQKVSITTTSGTSELGNIPVTFPIEFATAPFGIFTAAANHGGYCYAGAVQSLTKTSAVVNFLCKTTFSSDTKSHFFTAIGKWK